MEHAECMVLVDEKMLEYKPMLQHLQTKQDLSWKRPTEQSVKSFLSKAMKLALVYPHSWNNVDNRKKIYWVGVLGSGILSAKAYVKTGYYRDGNAFASSVTHQLTRKFADIAGIFVKSRFLNTQVVSGSKAKVRRHIMTYCYLGNCYVAWVSAKPLYPTEK
jgi:hypothetical protein